MATSIERLTDRQVKTTKKSLNDGGNLWLLKRKDSKLWAFRYTIKGRARKAGLGGSNSINGIINQATKASTAPQNTNATSVEKHCPFRVYI